MIWAPFQALLLDVWVRSAEPRQLDRWCRSRGAGRRSHSRLAPASRPGPGRTPPVAPARPASGRTLGSLRPQPDRTRAGRCRGWTGSSWRRAVEQLRPSGPRHLINGLLDANRSGVPVGPVAIRGAWDTIWGPRTSCAVSEDPGTCPGSRQSRRSTPPAAQAGRDPGGRASAGCRPDAGNPGAATGPRAVSGHRFRVRPLTTTRQMGHHPHIEQTSHISGDLP
jgi:hypothetical protein